MKPFTVVRPFEHPLLGTMRNAVSGAALLLHAVLTLVPVEASALIYQCVDETGHRTFTDRGCPGQQTYEPPASPAMRFEPLSEAEVKRLEESRRRHQQQQISQLKTRQAHQRRRRQQSAEARAQCADAKAQLESLRAQRREGYAAKSARALDEKAQSLKKRRRRYC